MFSETFLRVHHIHTKLVSDSHPKSVASSSIPPEAETECFWKLVKFFYGKKMVLLGKKSGTISKQSHKESLSYWIMRVDDKNSNSIEIYDKYDWVYNELFIH